MKRFNARALKSRRKLGEALVSLILERGFDKLTVTAVRKRAEVGHATFYRHFRTLDELLTDILLNTMRELAQRLREQENIYDETVALFRFIKEHQDRFQIYVDLPPTHPVRDILKAEAVKIVVDRWEARGASPVPEELAINHVVESSYTFIRWHLSHIDDHTPEEAAEFYYDLIVAGAETKALTLRSDKQPHPALQHED